MYTLHTYTSHSLQLGAPSRHCLTGRAFAWDAQSSIRKNWWALDGSTASNTASNKVFTLPAAGGGSIFRLPFSATLQQFWKKSNSQYLHLRHSLQTHTAKMNYSDEGNSPIHITKLSHPKNISGSCAPYSKSSSNLTNVSINTCISSFDIGIGISSSPNSSLTTEENIATLTNSISSVSPSSLAIKEQ